MLGCVARNRHFSKVKTIMTTCARPKMEVHPWSPLLVLAMASDNVCNSRVPDLSFTTLISFVGSVVLVWGVFLLATEPSASVNTRVEG